MYVCIYVCMCVFMYVCVCVCVHMCTIKVGIFSLLKYYFTYKVDIVSTLQSGHCVQMPKSHFCGQITTFTLNYWGPLWPSG